MTKIYNVDLPWAQDSDPWWKFPRGRVPLAVGIGVSLDGFLGSLYTEIAAGGGIYLSDYCISDNGQCTTHTKNLLKDSEINIYPNPVKDKLSIEAEKTILSVSVYDFSGRLIITCQNKEIDLSKLKSGPYLIETQLKDQYIHRSKIIKI